MVHSAHLFALAVSGAVVSAIPFAPERIDSVIRDIECRGLGGLSARCAKPQYKQPKAGKHHSFVPFPTASASGGFFPTGSVSSYPTATGYTASSVVAAAESESSSSVVSSASAAATSASSNSTATGSSGSNSTTGTSSCTATSDCTFTDASSAMSAQASCSCLYLSNIEVPAETTLDLTSVADGTTIVFDGTTTFAYGEWEGPMISVAGTSITVTGTSGHEINAGGEQYWDGEGSNGGKTKPKFFAAHKMIDSTISGLNILNTPVQAFSINDAQNLSLDSITIDDSAGDGDDGGHNTDAFDVGSSTGVYITNANIKNQDDCLAINSGTDISFTGGTCSGGHGLSIGSVGGRDDNTVENIYIADSTVTSSENGVRIKTVSGATGSVKNVTYSNIQLSSISDYGIVVEQDYENGDPTGTPTDGVPVTDLTLDTVTGTVDSDADNIYILCASCSDWTWTGVSVTGGKTDSDCEGLPSGISC